MGRIQSTINNLCAIKQISYFNKNSISAPIKRRVVRCTISDMDLKEILDKAKIAGKFEKSLDCDSIEYEYDSRNFSAISLLAKKNPDVLFSSAMTVWNRIVSNNLFPVDSMAVAKFASSHDPQVHRKISQIIGENIIKAFVYTKCQIDDEDLDYKTVCEFVIFELYPNILHLGDITFSDPYKPISNEEKKFEHQDFEGLGMLSSLMNNINEYAKQKSFDYITLTSASKDQIPLFKKYGFTPENNAFTNQALNIGYSIPMEKKI